MKRIFLIALFVVIAFACAKEEDFHNGMKPSIVMSETEFVIPASGNSISITAVSRVPLQVEIPDGCEWISFSSSQNYIYNFKIAENTGYEERTAEIKFVNTDYGLNKSVNIKQMQIDAIICAANEYNVGLEGKELNLDIQANIDYTINISEDAKDWIQLVETRGLVENKLTLKILPCLDQTFRVGSITFTGETASQVIRIIQGPTQNMDNIIWYVTSNHNKVETNPTQFDRNIISHTYTDGVGIIEFDGPITKIVNVFNSSYITELHLPNSLEHIGLGCISETSLKSLRLPDNLKSIEGALTRNSHMSQFSGKYASHDGKCVIINNTLFAFAPSGTKHYKFPDEIECIASSACASSRLESIVLPEGLKEIQEGAFYNCPLSYLTLPQSLERLAPSSFLGCNEIQCFQGNSRFVSDDNLCLITNETDTYPIETDVKNLILFAKCNLTDYTIQEGITHIYRLAFSWKDNELKSITLPKSIRSIDYEAFDYCDIEKVYGDVASEDNRFVVIDERLETYIARKDCPTHFRIPDNVRIIRNNALRGTKFEEITMGDQHIEIESFAFSGCDNLKSITMSANCKFYGSLSYNLPTTMQSIFFRSVIPPSYEWNYEVNNSSNATLYIPKGSLAAYEASCWHKEVRNIREFEYFDLPNIDYYYSSDYTKNGKVITLQKASEGNGIDVVFMGDGFSDRQIKDGTYDSIMENVYYNFFTKEPFKSFKHLFNVYYVYAVSPTEGYEFGSTSFTGYLGEGTLCGGNDKVVVQYALKAIDEKRMDNATISVIMNTPKHKGTCYCHNPEKSSIPNDWGAGLGIAYSTVHASEFQRATVLHHEACGHGFAKLGDEYAYAYNGTIPDSEIVRRTEQYNLYGWWKNIDYTNDLEKIRWHHFISDQRYSDERIGAYEGGLTYWNGAWRPTYNSIMRNDYDSFNAPSREAIYYRIHKLAYGPEWQYDYEKFVEWDLNQKKSNVGTRSIPLRLEESTPTHPPVVMGKSWKEAYMEVK